MVEGIFFLQIKTLENYSVERYIVKLYAFFKITITITKHYFVDTIREIIIIFEINWKFSLEFPVETFKIQNNFRAT